MELTRFVNIDNEDFTGYHDRQPWSIKAGEEKQVPIYLAKHFAKHLVDRVLQKGGVKNTLTDTPLRRDTLAKIIPDLAEEANVKQVSEEERKKLFEETITTELRKLGDEFGEKMSLKDKEIEELKAMVEKLIADKSPKSRTAKN